MARVILTEQPAYEHRCVISVRATDINYTGHIGNEALLELVHEARACLLRDLNFITIVSHKQPVGLIIADLAVNFKAEAFAWDQLVIESQIGELGQKSFRLFHRIRRGEQLVALVEIGMVAFSYHDRQVVPLPENFLHEIKQHRS